MEKKELFQEIENVLLELQQPSAKLEEISKMKEFSEFPFSLLLLLKSTEQSEKYHPEGSAWIHTLMVVDEAAKLKQKSTDPVVFMWAALLHDVGKPSTTQVRKGRITSYDHDRAGAKLIKNFFRDFDKDELFVKQVEALVLYHMHILYVNRNLPFAKVANLKKEARVEDVALLGFADRMGRLGADYEVEKEEIAKFYNTVSGKIWPSRNILPY